MRNDLTQMKLDIQGVQKDVKFGNEKLGMMHEDLRRFILDAEQKFARKWTEKLLVFVGSAVGLALIGALMALLLRNPAP